MSLGQFAESNLRNVRVWLVNDATNQFLSVLRESRFHVAW
jgi:hypothetical protein